MTTRILVDRHHHALLESLLLLFEDRRLFGDTEVWTLYGMEWFDSGIFQFEKTWHGDRVARQYLEGVWACGTEMTDDGSVVTVRDHRFPGRLHKGIRLAAARDIRWDYVISTLPDNDAGLHALARATGATFGVQVGNHCQIIHDDLAEFILASSTLPQVGLIDPSCWARPLMYRGVPTIIYHQEFDLGMFRPEWPPANHREAASFMNSFAETPGYPFFLALAREDPAGFDWHIYGAYGSAPIDQYAAGDISAVPEVADRMRGCRIGIHLKTFSDGFGHVIHDWFAIGRPVVGIASYYRDKLAAPLWLEGVTSFDIESRPVHETLSLMRRLRDDDDYHREICENSAARFRELVDFDAEADAVRFLMEAVRS